MDALRLKKALQETDLLTPGVGNLNLEELLKQKTDLWKETRGISYEIAFHCLTHAGLPEEETRLLIENNTKNPALTKLIKGLLAQKEDPLDLERPDIFSKEFLLDIKKPLTEEIKDILLNLAECRKNLAEKYERENKKAEAAMEYKFLGRYYARIGRLEEAADYMILCAKICLNEGMLPEAAKIYSYAAEYSHLARNNAKATEYEEKAIEYYLEDGKIAEAAKECSFAAEYFHLARNNAKATEYEEKAIEYYLEDGKIAEVARQYSFRARRQSTLGLPNKAVEYAKSSEKYYLEAGENKKAARESISTGVYLNQAGRYLEAIEYLKKPLRHYLDSDDYAGVANVYSHVGDFYTNACMFKEAGNYKEKSAEYHLKAGKTAKAAKEYSHAGANYHKAGLFLKAAESSERSIEYLLKAGNTADVAKECSYAGANYYKLGLFQKAAEYKKKSAEYLLAEGKIVDAAHEYGYAGSYYDKAGMIREGAECKEKSAEYHLKAGNTAITAKEYSYAGYYYDRAGMFKEAGECKEKSAEYHLEAGNTAKAAIEYSFAGTYFNKAEMPQKAAICAKLSGENYLKEGKALETAKEYSFAASYYEKAGILKQAAEYAKLSAENYLKEGNVLETAKEYSFAASYYNKVEMFKEAGDSAKLAAEYYLNEGDFTEAAKVYSYAGSYYNKAGMFKEAADCDELYIRYFSGSAATTKPAAPAEKKEYTIIESRKKILTSGKPRKGKSQKKTSEEIRLERVVREVAMFLGRNNITAEAPSDIISLANAIIASWERVYEGIEPKKPVVSLEDLDISETLKTALDGIPDIGSELGNLGHGGMLITEIQDPASSLKDIISDVYGTAGERFAEWHKHLSLSQQIIWAAALAKGSVQRDEETRLVLGLVHEHAEALPKGDIYLFLADNAKRLELASRNEVNWARYRDQFTREGWAAVTSAAKALEKTRLPEISTLDPKEYAETDKEGRLMIRGRYLDLFRKELSDCVERYINEFDLSDDVVLNQLRNINVELILGNAHAAHYDAKDNKLVVYLSFDRFSPEERDRLAMDGMNQEIENLELIYNDNKIFHEIVAGIHRAASNLHVKDDLVPSQADTYTGDYTEGICIYLSTKWRLESPAFSLTKVDRGNFWKLVFSQDRLYDPIGPEYLEQYLQVEEWLSMGKREQLLDRISATGYPLMTKKMLLKELPRFPKYVQRMFKGRFHLSPDDLKPYTRIEDIETAAEKLRIIKDRIGSNPNLLTRIESYPEALVIKLVVTIATARKDQPQTRVVEESLKLLQEMIGVFDQGERGELKTGLVYHTYTKVFPKVCEG